MDILDTQSKEVIIICSAISTSLQMTLIGIQEVLKLKVDFKINDGFLDVDLKNISLDKLTQTNILTETMAIFLKELTKQYPKYIRLVEKEDKVNAIFIKIYNYLRIKKGQGFC